MRRKDGGFHQEPGYLGVRAAIQRQLNIHDRNFNIFTDTEFTKSNGILDGVLKKRRRDGDMNPVKHKELISSFNLDKIKPYY